MTAPKARLSELNRADGSAQYSANGYTVVGAVNGPIEVQRRDELPEEATIEVNIRPDIGVGSAFKIRSSCVGLLTQDVGTKERHLESILHSTLKRIILTHSFPRTLIQLTLQVVQAPQRYDSRFVSSVRDILYAESAMLIRLKVSANPPSSSADCHAVTSFSGRSSRFPFHLCWTCLHLFKWCSEDRSDGAKKLRVCFIHPRLCFLGRR